MHKSADPNPLGPLEESFLEPGWCRPVQQGNPGTPSRMCTDALRAGLDGALFHVDHGCRYVSQKFAEVCRELR